MTTRTVATWIAAATATLTASAVLAGCGTSTSPASTAPAPSASSAPAAQAHNPADVSFVQGMLPHHTQAVEMSQLAATRASSPQVKDLAARIHAAQQPEIEQMTALLRAWNAALPAMNGPSMGGMDHPNMDQGGVGQGGMGPMEHGGMAGMMSSAQMQQLGQASGAAFDRMFLQMMLSHHQGAVTMSTSELRDGQNPDAKALAQRIIDAQQREITEMQTLPAK